MTAEKLHPSQTPEYWERLARDERAFAKVPHQTVESVEIRLRNAVEYEATAAKLRSGPKTEAA